LISSIDLSDSREIKNLILCRQSRIEQDSLQLLYLR
jgi:hypothetical protein